MLRAEGISVQKGDKLILDGVDLEVRPGECVGIIGPNGAGKSTLLKVLALLEAPDEGVVFYNGVQVSLRPALTDRRRLAVVFQEPLLLNTTVYENVAVGLKIRGVAKSEISARVQHWLEIFGIWHLAKHRARSLSGGEAQRVNLARAFILEPDVIFLDEPFSALDVRTRNILYVDLAQVFASTKAAAVLISHDYREIELLTHRVVMLDNGKKVASGTPQELLHSTLKGELGGFLDNWIIAGKNYSRAQEELNHVKNSVNQ